mgnify:CR=1 FL=1
MEWETDPAEMKGTPFYRLMGFVIDRRYRNGGIGSYVLEKVIRECYQEFGIRSVAPDLIRLPYLTSCSNLRRRTVPPAEILPFPKILL